MYTTWIENDVFKESETYMYPVEGEEVGRKQPRFGALQAPLSQ